MLGQVEIPGSGALVAAAVALHAAAAVGAVGALRGRRGVGGPRWVRGVILAAVAADVALLVLIAWRTRRAPVASLFESLIITAMALGIIGAVIAFRGRLRGVNAILLPVALALVAAALPFYGRAAEPGPPVNRFWILVHALLLLAGVAGLSVGFAASVLFLMQHHALKDGRLPGLISRVPSQEALERLRLRATDWAVPLLTAGMLTGVLVAVANPAWRSVLTGPKTIATCLAWLTLAVVLPLQHVAGVRGRKPAWLTVLGFGVMAFAIVGVAVVWNPLHGVVP